MNTCSTIQVISKQQFQKQNSKQILFEIKIWVGNKKLEALVVVCSFAYEDANAFNNF
jgi:hypothetical protein